MVVDEDAGRGPDGGWGRTATVAGAVAAAGVVVQSVLFLLDGTALPAAPPYRETVAGRDADLAAFFAARAQHEHDVLWDIVLRDLAGPVAMVALLVLAAAVVRTRGRGRAGPQAWALVLAVGALVKVLSDLVFLSQFPLWRQSGFLVDPPTDMIAVGRASDVVDHVSGLLESASDVLVAAGLVGLAVLLSRPLRLLARVLAVVLVLGVAAGLADWSAAYAALSLLGGVLLAPVLLAGTGRWVARAGPDDRRSDPAAVREAR